MSPELFIPWSLCLVFVVIAAVIVWDSRATESRVEQREEACARREAAMDERERNVQRVLNEKNASLRTQHDRIRTLERMVIVKDSEIAALDDQNKKLRLRAGRN